MVLALGALIVLALRVALLMPLGAEVAEAWPAALGAVSTLRVGPGIVECDIWRTYV